MAQEEADQSVVLGQGAKLAGFVVIIVAAFAMGFSTASRRNANQDGQVDQRLDEFNQALFHSMMSGHQTADLATDEVASTVDEGIGPATVGK
jgi:hypothetical protein